MKSFKKSAKSFSEQVELLKSRGMIINDEATAQFYLAQINYYRLGAYCLPFEQSHSPHCFAVCEVMSFGQLSKWYQQLAVFQTRKAIAQHFDCDEKQFEGLLHHFVYLRNICAHHARLWNRKFTKTIAQPRTKPLGLRVQCNFDIVHTAERKLYNSLVFLLYFLDKIAPQHTWRSRLVYLLNLHPRISKTWMGFPNDWQRYPIWQVEQD